MSCAAKGPCPKCGGTDWHDEPAGHRSFCRCRTCSAARQRSRRKRRPELSLHDHANRRARHADVPFELSLADVRDLLADWSCSYCDGPVGSFEGGIRPDSATLDRLIPDLGYTCSNTVLACHRCNSAKGEHTPQSLRLWANRIEAVIHRKNPIEEA